jgi:hypothetical protein
VWVLNYVRFLLNLAQDRKKKAETVIAAFLLFLVTHAGFKPATF